MSRADARFDEAYFARTYRDYERQNPRRKMVFYRRLAERAVRGLGAPRVLDVGCGPGRFLASLDPAWSLHGCDVSEYALARARQALPGASFSVGGADDPPAAGPFDLVTAFDVLEHVPDLDAAARAIAARLAPEGRLLFVVPVYDGPAGVFVRLLDRDPTHIHKRSRRAWLDWAEATFRVEEWWGIVRYLLPGGVYFHVPGRALRRIAPAIAILASLAPAPPSPARSGPPTA